MFCFGCSAGGTFSLATAHKLIEKGKGDILKGVINCAGGTVHLDFVPERFRGRYNAMKENGSGTPIIDTATTRMVNGKETFPGPGSCCSKQESDTLTRSQRSLA